MSAVSRASAAPMWQGAIVFAATMTANGANYLLHLFLVRRLGLVDYAAVSAILATVTIVGIVGVAAGAEYSRSVADARARLAQDHVHRIGSIALRWSLVTGLVAMLVAFALEAPIGQYLHVSPGAGRWAAILLGVSLALPALRGVLQGAESFVAWGVSTAIEGIVRLATALPLVANGFGIEGSVAGLVGGSAAALVCAIVFIPRGSGSNPRDLVWRGAIPPLLGIAMFDITALQMYDLVLAKHYLSAYDAGLYSAAAIAGRAVFMVVSSVPIVLLPRASFAASQGAPTKRLLVAAIATATILASVCVGLISLGPGTFTAAIAGGASRAAGSYVVIYSIATAALALAFVVASYRIGISDFQFVPLLSAVLAAEVVGVVLFHRSALDVLTVLLIGHIAALGATAFRLTVTGPLR